MICSNGWLAATWRKLLLQPMTPRNSATGRATDLTAVASRTSGWSVQHRVKLRSSILARLRLLQLFVGRPRILEAKPHSPGKQVPLALARPGLPKPAYANLG